MVKNSGFIRKANLLFKYKIDKAISIILKKNLEVKPEESLLIVYDSVKGDIAKRFEKIALQFLERVDKVKTPVSKVGGQEPPKKVSDMMTRHDIIIILTKKSLSHTKARRDATDKGARIASMPGITETILRRSIDIDYKKLKIDTQKVAKALDKAKEVTIKTQYGSEIKLGVKGRKAHGLSAGTYDKKGKWGNLPEGEAFIAPVEGTTNGTFVVDGSIAGFGKVNHPIIFFVKNGYVEKIADGKKPPEIEKVLDKVGPEARNIAELGIGLNRKAKITGRVLEDEKVYGTCHIALGNNIGFGGKVDVPLHIDCVMKSPTIYFDKKMIMKKGRLIL